MDISGLCSKNVKYGAAFDSDSEDEEMNEFSSLKKEYDCFVSMKYKPGNDVWKWFEANKKAFPRIYNLCKKLLVVKASSASSERFFSKAGIIFTAKRSSLLPDTASNLILLSTNSKLVYEIYS